MAERRGKYEFGLYEFGPYVDEDLEDYWCVWKAAQAQAASVPVALYNGYAVYRHLSGEAKVRTNSSNVSDVLAALIKLIEQEQNHE